MREARPYYGWGPALLWGTAIIVTAVIPIEAPPLRTPFIAWDTLAHSVVYAIFALLMARLLWWSVAIRHRLPLIGWSVGSALALGMLCEALQWRIPYRSASIGDLVADGVGAGVAAVLYTQWVGRWSAA